jgi:hypothetical protein
VGKERLRVGRFCSAYLQVREAVPVEKDLSRYAFTDLECAPSDLFALSHQAGALYKFRTRFPPSHLCRARLVRDLSVDFVLPFLDIRI